MLILESINKIRKGFLNAKGTTVLRIYTYSLRYVMKPLKKKIDLKRNPNLI
jgi:hypothetical protein